MIDQTSSGHCAETLSDLKAGITQKGRLEMKRFISPLIIIICLMMFSPAEAEITWHNSETEFDYSINHLSYFIYSEIAYYRQYNLPPRKYNDWGDPYNSVAEIQVSEYQNIPQAGSGIQIQARALGPPNGIDPANGLMVQAFLNTVATGLNATRK